eukprot:TRINITY_DN8630_c0_g1_i11.p1 TRINITY_DN8630_c0_g1~~TRINITY_DN8630_c0_g1_i11.p1  ORF type:complete len:242 (+),score=40.08 TRINITY_DN8630_c0_g1_i11:132-857(+)
MRQQLNKNNSKDKQNSKESQNLDKRKKYYNPQLVNRPTFVAASQKVVYFGKNSNIFLDSSGVIGQLQRQASIFPDRIKNQIQFRTGRTGIFGHQPQNQMSKKQLQLEQKWQDINETIREDNYSQLMKSQSGRERRISYQQKQIYKSFIPSSQHFNNFDVQLPNFKPTKHLEVLKTTIDQQSNSNRSKCISHHDLQSQNSRGPGYWKIQKKISGFFADNPYQFPLVNNSQNCLTNTIESQYN